MQGIICPHCKHEHEDWQNYIDAGDMDGDFTMDCIACEESFHVIFTTTITFNTTK